MEMKHYLMWCNDPRVIYKDIRHFGGYCYYANHYEKIIRDGTFLSGSRQLNGNGILINYANNIKITIGKFNNDNPVESYTTIISHGNFYKSPEPNFYYCNANKKEYMQIKRCDIVETNLVNFFDIAIKIKVINGQLINYNMTDDNFEDYTIISYNNIFNNAWYDKMLPHYHDYKNYASKHIYGV